MLLLPGAQVGPCLSFLGQACAEKFRWETCQLNVGAEHCFKNALDVCVCVCVCVCECNYAKHRILFEQLFPQSCILCSRGPSLMLAVFNPKQLPGLPFYLEPLLQCRVEVNGKDIDRPVILLNTCCWFLPADWPGRDLPVPSRNYTNAVLRKTVNAFIVKKLWIRTGFVMLSCVWAYFP